MTERPALPTELRRRVLLEAGHRCAIHTCRHVDVDVHHIEPWARCGEHRFENLIALCPNCHRLAEGGKIDRNSLRLYKARLGAAFHFEKMNFYPEETVLPAGFAWADPSGEWATESRVNDGPKIEIGFEYPRFGEQTLGAASESVNRYIRDFVDESINRFTTEMSDSSDVEEVERCYLNSSFAVTLLRSPVVSVRFAMTSYTGGVHGSQWTEAQNLLTKPARALSIVDLFTDPNNGISALSEFAVSELTASSVHGVSRDEDWVRQGAGPDSKNFKSFNLTSRGILLTFDEYQVGSYAEGASEVHVPYSAVAHILNPTVSVEVLGSYL